MTRDDTAPSPSLRVLPWHEDAWHTLNRRQPLPHSLLVTGPGGSGLAEFALAVAAATLCEAQDTTGSACGACRSCLWLSTHEHPDALLLGSDFPRPLRSGGEEGADGDGDDAPERAREDREGKEGRQKQVQVGDVRDLIEFLHVGAQVAAGRVAVISPAHLLNTAAANALLKVLEEPPRATRIVLATPHERRLLPTVRSRCHVLRLRKPDRPTAIDWLRARGTAQPELSLDVSGQAPLKAAALSDDYWEERRRMLDLLSAPWDTGRIPMPRDELPLPVLLDLLQTWVMDVMATDAGTAPRYHVDRVDALRRAAKRSDLPALLAYARRLQEARRLVDHPLNPKLLLQDLLLAHAGCYREA